MVNDVVHRPAAALGLALDHLSLGVNAGVLAVSRDAEVANYVRRRQPTAMMMNMDDFLVPLIAAFVTTGVGSFVSALQARRAKTASDAEELKQSRQSDEISRLLREAEETLSERVSEGDNVPPDDETELRGPDRQVAPTTHDRSAANSERLNMMRSAKIDRVVREALEDFAEKENASRVRERKADRRLAIWLAVAGFFAGSLVTIGVSWIFASLSGVL